MNVTIHPKRSLSGEITAPPSKAQTHRALVAGLLSEGTTTITNPLSCDDTEATAQAASTLGAQVRRGEHTWMITSTGRPRAPLGEVHCGESGVTLRFMIPIVSLTGSHAVLRGKESLMRRPIQPLVEAMERLGVKVIVESDSVRLIGGPPKGGTVHIQGDVSSQFISGLMFAGPLMENGLRLEITSRLESRNYVLMTVETMRKHGMTVKTNREMAFFEIAPTQKYFPSEHEISGDFSSAAYPLSAAAITNSRLLVRGLSPTIHEPDTVLLDVLTRMGAKANYTEEGVLIEGAKLSSTDVDLRNSPDLGPIIAVLGSYAEGKTKISGARRLRFKESDRLAAIRTELNSLGAHIDETGEGLLVHGPCRLEGGRVWSHRDHRIAMALSAAALNAEGNVTVEEAECVSKSYPNFFEDLRSLGVEVVE